MNNTNAKRFIDIRTEVMDAYADNHSEDFEAASKIRNLNFLASGFVNRREAKEILKEAIPDGYNEFNYDLLDRFPDDSMFLIAREGSVCLYVVGNNLPSAQKVNADEKDIHNKNINQNSFVTVRYWWD